MKSIDPKHRALRLAQNSQCAGCGTLVPSARRLKRFDPNYPTFDHVIPKMAGGKRSLANGLLKHQKCNQARGAAPPNGCDLVWHAMVIAKLEAVGFENATKPQYAASLSKPWRTRKPDHTEPGVRPSRRDALHRSSG